MKKSKKLQIKKIIKRIKTIYKNGLKNENFDGADIGKYKFHQYKSPILINDTDINKIVASKMFTLGKQNIKYFIGDKDDKKLYLYA